MEKLFEINEKYTYEDYMELNKYHMFNSKKSNISIVLIYIAIVLVMLMGIYLKECVYIVLSILFAIIYPIMMFLTIKNVSKKAYETNKVTKNITQNISFYEKYFEVINEIGDTKIYYDKLYKIGESKNLFLLFISYNQAFIVKKSELSDIKKFKDFIESKK